MLVIQMSHLLTLWAEAKVWTCSCSHVDVTSSDICMQVPCCSVVHVSVSILRSREYLARHPIPLSQFLCVLSVDDQFVLPESYENHRSLLVSHHSSWRGAAMTSGLHHSVLDCVGGVVRDAQATPSSRMIVPPSCSTQKRLYSAVLSKLNCQILLTGGDFFLLFLKTSVT